MTTRDGLFLGDDGLRRCAWCAASPLYRGYHDQEWGFPVIDDRRLFEKICLEGFQAGLSWLTILNKREAFRRAFANFEADRIASFGKRDVTRLLGDAGIVRHRGKIESTIHNAHRVLELRDEFGSLSNYAWGFEPNGRLATEEADACRHCGRRRASTESTAMSKDLKTAGLEFRRPDHGLLPSCRRWASSTII